MYSISTLFIGFSSKLGFTTKCESAIIDNEHVICSKLYWFHIEQKTTTTTTDECWDRLCSLSLHENCHRLLHGTSNQILKHCVPQIDSKECVAIDRKSFIDIEFQTMLREYSKTFTSDWIFSFHLKQKRGNFTRGRICPILFCFFGSLSFCFSLFLPISFFLFAVFNEKHWIFSPKP